MIQQVYFWVYPRKRKVWGGPQIGIYKLYFYLKIIYNIPNL